MKNQFFLLLTFILSLEVQKNFAQDGSINDDFSTGNNYGWNVTTANASGQIKNGKYVITASLQSNGKYRGDFKRSGGVTFNAGTFPIVAIKINKPPRCNWFFDTNLGSYNNGNNNSTKIITDSGNVYYWDLSTGRLGTTVLSTTQSTSLSLFQFKIADIDFSSAELAAQDYSYEVSWIKTFRSVDELRTYVNPSGTTNPVFEYSGAFIHPGLLHTTSDFARMKDQVARQVARPYKSYQLLSGSSYSSYNYSKAGPFKYFTRDGSLTIETPTGTVSGGVVKGGVERDVMAAYYNALMWNINGNELHAKKAIEILDAYSGFSVGITGVDAELNGLYGFMLANAAELMRYTYSGWPQDKVQQCQNMLQNVFYPVLQNFKPCSHGNWDIICMKALMSIAIFRDDNAMFNKVVNYFYYGQGNGSIKNYVLTDAGQLQESNRDQAHSMLAIGSLAELAEMAYKQGFDLYSANNNAIMRGYEYTAKYNLGYDVPYVTSYDFCEKNYQDYTPEAISATGRGSFRSVFEIGYNHYVYRKNKSMPSTLEALGTVLNPEGAPFGADNPGYGSLFFYLNPDSNYVSVPGNNGSNNAGLINDNFTGTNDGWIAATTGAVATIGANEITITMKKQTNGTYRGDFRRSAGAIVHNGNFPILAIKIKKPAGANMTFDTNLGSFGNGANKWTGKVGADIYYYDMTKGFGSAPVILSTTGPTTFSTFQFKMADLPAGGDTTYTVDWVKTVKTVADLQNLVVNPPLVKVKNIQLALNDSGRVSIDASQVDDGSVSYSGALTLSLDRKDFQCTDIGSPIPVTLTATDSSGHTGTGSALVTIVDTTKPVISIVADKFFCFDSTGSYFIPLPTITDNCGLSSIDFTITGTTNRSGSGADASGNFNPGKSFIAWTVADVHGNVSTQTTTITVNPPLSVSIPDVYALNPAVDAKNTLYLGYGPAAITLTANVSGQSAPYSYSWSNGVSAQSTNVTTQGIYTVTVTDVNGCSVQSVIAINTMDVRCGNDDSKVMVCHNNKAICVSSSAVQAHLQHGDKLGNCSDPAVAGTNSQNAKIVAENNFQIYPNPSSDNIIIQLKANAQLAIINVFNAQGQKLINTSMTGSRKQLSIQSLPRGVYFVQVRCNGDVITKKIIKE